MDTPAEVTTLEPTPSSPPSDGGGGGLLNMLLPLLQGRGGDTSNPAVEALAQAIQSLSSTNAQLLVELRERREDALYWRRRAEKFEAAAEQRPRPSGKTASVRVDDQPSAASVGVSLQPTAPEGALPSPPGTPPVRVIKEGDTTRVLPSF